MFKAIIFDMDGLLVDSETVWHEAEDQMIADYGHVYTAEARAGIVGLRVDAFMAYLKDYYQLPPSVAELKRELEDRFMAHMPGRVKAQPGAAELLTWVMQQHIPHAVASNSPIRIVEAVLNDQGWQAIFTIRCSADDDANGKPAPDVYLRAARLVGVDPADCLALEDSRNGARGAVAAGMTCYAVPDLSHTSPEAFAEITPHVFRDLHAVLENLRTL